jgi:hypothetical protein
MAMEISRGTGLMKMGKFQSDECAPGESLERKGRDVKALETPGSNFCAARFPSRQCLPGGAWTLSSLCSCMYKDKS